MPSPVAFEVCWTWEGFVLEGNSIVLFGRSTRNKTVNDAGIQAVPHGECVKARLELPAAEKELMRRRGCADEPAKPATLVTPTRSIACATSVSRPPTSRW